MNARLKEQKSPSGPARTLGESPVALLLIDVVNPMQFDGAEKLLPRARQATGPLAALRGRARDARAAVIYVNDNFDCWHLGLRELIEKFKEENVPGVELFKELEPDFGAEFFILKPRNSGFYRTGLEVLLERLQTKTLVLTGFATDICVLFTAYDAHMRNFDVIVASDCVAAEGDEEHSHALRQMARLLQADVLSSTDIDFGRLAHNRMHESEK
jgi:nicotinamidase-related amidase